MWLYPTRIGIRTGECGGDCYRELPRILLPRTPVNRAQGEGAGLLASGLFQKAMLR
jgi:hypothetical protein